MRRIIFQGRSLMVLQAVILVLCIIFPSLGTSIAQTETIKIGVILPRYGDDELRGIKLAFDLLSSEATFKNQNFQLFVRDGDCESYIAYDRAKDLIYHYEVAVLVVPGCTDTDIVDQLSQEASVAFLSTGGLSEDSSSRGKTSFQLGVSYDKVARLAKKLSSKNGPKVDGQSSCLWTYKPYVESGFAASICPSLSVERKQWQNFLKQYHQQFEGEPSTNVAKGFAAIQIIFQATAKNFDMNNPRRSMLTALREGKFATVLGSGEISSSNGLINDLRVIVNPSINSFELQTLTFQVKPLVKDDDCDKCKNGECPQGSLIFTSKKPDCCKKKNGECPQGALIFFR
jgi:ABC-type branched-subunit amino acid transport system substrate-binding protein